MSQLIALTAEYLSRWPTIAAYILERPELSGWLLVEDQQPCSLVIMSPQRVHYIYTVPDARRVGYATLLLAHLLHSTYVQQPLRVTVPKTDLAALRLFISSDFEIVGFNHSNKAPSYILEYKKPALIVQHVDTLQIDAECNDLLNKIHVVEALPIYL